MAITKVIPVQVCGKGEFEEEPARIVVITAIRLRKN
jgi:hypothetical protein